KTRVFASRNWVEWTVQCSGRKVLCCAISATEILTIGCWWLTWANVKCLPRFQNRYWRHRSVWNGKHFGRANLLATEDPERSPWQHKTVGYCRRKLRWPCGWSLKKRPDANQNDANWAE